MASYAYEISEYDKRFVALLEAENGAWTHNRKHVKPYYLCWDHNTWESGYAPNQQYNSQKCDDGSEGWFWRKHYDWGFCGMSDGYKAHITRDENFFDDQYWQIEQCYNEYKAGTTFYGMNNVDRTINNFIFNE